MLLAVVNGVVINGAEPLLDSAVRQMVERHSPKEPGEWVACYLVALETVDRAVGRRVVVTILN